MDDDKKRAFGLASEAKAHANEMLKRGHLNDLDRKNAREIKRCLEQIERRTDPAADPEYEA